MTTEVMLFGTRGAAARETVDEYWARSERNRIAKAAEVAARSTERVEIRKQATADDPWSRLEALGEAEQRRDPSLSREQGIVKAMAANPSLAKAAHAPSGADPRDPHALRVGDAAWLNIEAGAAAIRKAEPALSEAQSIAKYLDTPEGIAQRRRCDGRDRDLSSLEVLKRAEAGLREGLSELAELRKLGCDSYWQFVEREAKRWRLTM